MKVIVQNVNADKVPAQTQVELTTLLFQIKYVTRQKPYFFQRFIYRTPRTQ